ncbi:hypothetical protein LPJ53_006245 [Coemansia erecta]|uniref:Barwin-like endoglucanase n=1 Tax=Coemansia erecta TaxID=147472 RepID=A0A9W7XUW3_9FUNG|nr:hypothetical protein LPJ53_006245 [Coemansia erecta]
MKYFISTIALTTSLLSAVLGASVTSTSGSTASVAPYLHQGAVNPLDDGFQGCGRVNSPDAYYVTVAETLYGFVYPNGNSDMCNKCIKLHGPTDTVVVEIIGPCEGCVGDSLEISDKAMDDLQSQPGVDLDRIGWEYVKCPKN